MQNNDNQTIKNDPNNRGQNEVESISPELSSIWLGIECLVKTFNRGEEEKIDADEIAKLLVESGNPNKNAGDCIDN